MKVNVQVLLAESFRRQKSFTMKACAEFYCRQIAEKH